MMVRYFRCCCWGVMSLTVFMLVACGGSGSGSGGASPSGAGGSSSGSGENVDFPGDIIGERVEFTVTEALTDSSVAVGLEIVYDFSVDGRVRGTNPETGQVLEPVRYNYKANGNNATILLYYEYSNGGKGYEEYNLYGDGSIMQGAYDYEAVVTEPNQYSAGKAKGKYRIVPPNNVVVYQFPSAEDVPVEQESIWHFMSREDDFSIVSADKMDHAYVGIHEDGALVSDTSGFCSTCDEVYSLFKEPPSGAFVAAEVASLLGMAISKDGDLWAWAGEGYYAPFVIEGVEYPAHDFVKRSRGHIVISGPGRNPEVVCKRSDGDCSYPAHEKEQLALDSIDAGNIDKAVAFRPFSGPIFLYTDINDGFLRLADACDSNLHNCDPPVIPAGIGQVVDFDLHAYGDASVFVAIESTGQVVAWDRNGHWLPVPLEVGSAAVDLAVSAHFDSSAYVAVVREDGKAVIWRYDMDTRKIIDVQVPSEVNNVTKVYHTSYAGHFLFL